MLPLASFLTPFNTFSKGTLLSLLVLNTTSTPSGISSEYAHIPLRYLSLSTKIRT